MSALSHRIAALNAMLAPHATPHDRRERAVPEEDDGIRTAFQRDRARIIHSQAFRRLAGKTQVFVAGEGDHYRTRLTHTLEVAQITRDLARALSLNEDLAECVALAHDLGHTPFGHAGQDALDAWMKTQGNDGFEHNVQSHRVVTVLERRGTRNGLNLTLDVVHGLLKHGPIPLCPEAQLANVCDAIAYTAHDTDDGLRAGLFTFDALLAVPFARRAADHANTRNVLIRSAIIDLLARDVLTHSAAANAIDLSPSIRDELSGLRSFLWERMYHHPHILERTNHGQRCIRTLCDTYFATPPETVLDLQLRTGSTLAEAVKDHVAGMTDSYATKAFSAL